MDNLEIYEFIEKICQWHFCNSIRPNISDSCLNECVLRLAGLSTADLSDDTDFIEDMEDLGLLEDLIVIAEEEIKNKGRN